MLRAGGDGDEAAQAAVAQAQADEATQEIMKQLNFPEVEKASKAPQVAPKISKCLQKRITKLQECQNKFVGELNQNQKMRLVIDFFGIKTLFVFLFLGLCVSLVDDSVRFQDFGENQDGPD